MATTTCTSPHGSAGPRQRELTSSTPIRDLSDFISNLFISRHSHKFSPTAQMPYDKKLSRHS
eukprot:583849-Hanusia_phi.AAC.2